MFKTMLVVHRWFGITIGLYFVLLGLSGSYLVYRNTFQEWIGFNVRHTVVGTDRITLAQAAAIAQEGLGVDLQPTAFYISKNPKRNLEFSFSGLPGMGRAKILTFIDPYTGEYKGEENFKKTITGKIFFFHHDLFLGKPGRTIMALAGFAMLFLLLGGLYLWGYSLWGPRKISWKKALRLQTLRKPLQAHLEIHKFFGFYTFLLMLMVTFTGVYISKPNWFQKMQPRTRPSFDEPLPLIDFARLEAFLRDQQAPIHVQTNAKKSTFIVTKGRAKTHYDLKELNQVDPEPEPPKDMRLIQRSLHAGKFWSPIGKVLIFISGLLPLLFYITGVYVWWQKSKIRRNTRKKLRA